ncbi:cysteine synthase A [candidate division WOR-3 bacterium]|nr:cysteine synthase A [candidate division WOR-3 bacterium]
MDIAANNILNFIGNTPVVKLNKIPDRNYAEVYCKLEFFNPLGSVKDRIALYMIEDAERRGKIHPGDTLIEPTSGNTGIGLAYVTAVKGYKLILVMPDTMSKERIKILKALGAAVVLTGGALGMKGAVEKAADLSKTKGYFSPGQFTNPVNPEAHRKTTAKEILKQVPEIDVFVAGVGTGGTITGVGEVLKKEIKNKKILIVAVEPEGSPVLSGGRSGPHKIQGIGAGFIPEVLNIEIIDEIIKVKNEDAFLTSRRLAREEGIFAGVSSGAALWAALKIAQELPKEKKVVSILPDTGERYLSTDLFS